MSMILDTKIFVWGSQYWLHFHLCFTMILFYKMRWMLIQNVAFTLLENMIKVHYKMVWFFISKCNSLITKWGSHQKMRHSYSKCDIYYKMWRFLQNTLLLKGISVFHERQWFHRVWTQIKKMSKAELITTEICSIKKHMQKNQILSGLRGYSLNCFVELINWLVSVWLQIGF